MDDPTCHDVVVIGAGLSGLSAAKWLLERGVDVLVLEAQGRVGGKTWTKRDPAIDYIELGGSYVGPTQDYVLRMAKELGVETYFINEEEDLLFYNFGQRHRWKESSNEPFTWNIFAYLDVNNFYRLMDKMGEEIPSDEPWEAPHAREWDIMTFQQFMDDNIHTRYARSNVHIFQSTLAACEPHECSLLWFLWYVKQCGGSQRIDATHNGAQERKFKGGSQLLSEKLAERLNGVVTLQKPIVTVSQQAATVTLTTEDGSVYKAKHVILANSPAIQQKIHFQPSLPPIRSQLMQRMPMGAIIKCSLFYKTTFWKKLGFCGSLLIAGGDEHPVAYALDDTKPDGSHPAITGFIAGDKCRKMISKTKEERMKILSESYAEVFQSTDALNPLHYEEHCWMGEEYSGGCFTGFCPPGVLTEYGRVLRKPVGRIYFAGSETATQWSGYMDGAISSGERAAREVLYDMGKIGRDEIWRTEPRLKEFPCYDFELSFLERHLPSVPVAKVVLTTALLVGTIASATLLF